MFFFYIVRLQPQSSVLRQFIIPTQAYFRVKARERGRMREKKIFWLVKNLQSLMIEKRSRGCGLVVVLLYKRTYSQGRKKRRKKQQQKYLLSLFPLSLHPFKLLPVSLLLSSLPRASLAVPLAHQACHTASITGFYAYLQFIYL